MIIPVRNGAPFVARAIGSVLTQTLRSIEVVVVDDASDDDTPAVIAEIAARDTRVRTITLHTHGGPAVARRRGLELSNGRYVGFVDADDAALPQMFETLSRVAVAEHADVVVCNAYRVDETGAMRPRTALLRSRMLERDAALRRFLGLRLGGGTLWNRLFRSDLLAPLPLDRFDNLPINEDYAVNIGATNLAERYAVVTDFLYLCSERAGSVSRTVSASGYYLANLVEAWATTSAAYGDQSPALLGGIDKLYHRQLAFGHYHVRAGAWSADDAEAFAAAMDHLRSVRPKAVALVGPSASRAIARQVARARNATARANLRLCSRGYGALSRFAGSGHAA